MVAVTEKLGIPYDAVRWRAFGLCSIEIQDGVATTDLV
jgi:hypothetical protein